MLTNVRERLRENSITALLFYLRSCGPVFVSLNLYFTTMPTSRVLIVLNYVSQVPKRLKHVLPAF